MKKAANKQGSVSGFAFFLLVCYFFFEYVRPQDAFLPALAYLKIPMMISIILFFKVINGDREVLKDRLSVLLLLFLVEIGFSVVFAVNSYFVWRTFKGMALMLIIVLAMPMIIDSVKKLVSFLGIWMVINLILAIYVVLHHGRGTGGFTYDENDAALTLVAGTPVAMGLLFCKSVTRGAKMVYLGCALVMVAGIVASMSRGGFLGMMSIAVGYWLLSEKKVLRLLQVAALSLILSIPVLQLMPPGYFNEMGTITNVEDNTRNSRFYAWGLAWDMFLDNPVIGVGAGNFPWRVPEYQLRRPDFDLSTGKLLGGRAAHSLYFTLFAELGLLGAILYTMIVVNMVKRLRSIIKASKDIPELYDYAELAKSLLVSLFAVFVCGAFISVLYYPPFWYLVGTAMTLIFIVDRGIESKHVQVSKARSVMPGMPV